MSIATHLYWHPVQILCLIDEHTCKQARTEGIGRRARKKMRESYEFRLIDY